MRSMAATVAFSLAAIISIAVSGQSPAERSAAAVRPEVLVLGVYHMNNPGRDLFNMQADDVLSPKRQAEIAEVIAVLERFRPTKIAVEAGVRNKSVLEGYPEYVAGNHELTRNETEQLGFRLAKKLGHKSVFPVDADGEFPYLRVVKYAKATGRETELEAVQEETGQMVKALDAYLASHTVLETLLYMNSDKHVAAGMSSYLRLAQFGEPWDWAGADLVSDWFRRNMRIYSNIVQLIDSPDERVLVIYGAGHLGWLQFAFGGNQAIRLRKLEEFAGPGG